MKVPFYNIKNHLKRKIDKRSALSDLLLLLQPKILNSISHILSPEYWDIPDIWLIKIWGNWL